MILFISLFTFLSEMKGTDHRREGLAPWNVHKLNKPTSTFRSRNRTFPAVPLLSLPGHPDPATEDHHLTSNLLTRNSNLKFLKNWVSDIYKSGNLHFSHPLRMLEQPPLGTCLPGPPGSPPCVVTCLPPGGTAGNTCPFPSLDPNFCLCTFGCLETFAQDIRYIFFK